MSFFLLPSGWIIQPLFSTEFPHWAILILLVFISLIKVWFSSCFLILTDAVPASNSLDPPGLDPGSFPLFLCIDHLRKAFLSLLAILWNSVFKWVSLSFSPLLFTSLLFVAIYKASSDNHFAFLHFFFLGMVLITTSCTMSQTSIHSTSGTVCQL